MFKKGAIFKVTHYFLAILDCLDIGQGSVKKWL